MENLLAFNKNTQDGHGGRAELHRSEMKEVAHEVFQAEREQLMKEIEAQIMTAQYQAYAQAIQDVLRVLEYDIHSVTKIGIDGCREIFEGEKAQKYISNQIMKIITSELKEKRFRP